MRQNLMNGIVFSAMPTELMPDTLLKASEKQSFLDGIREYIKSHIGMFPHLELATQRLAISNGSDSLKIVEEKLQTQIKAIKDMQLSPFMKEKLRLYFNGFIDYLNGGEYGHKFKNGKDNDYVTHKQKRFEQMKTLALNYGLNPDKLEDLEESVNSYVVDPSTESIYSYQDLDKIENKILEISHNRNQFVETFKYERVAGGVQNIDMQKIGKALSEISQIFTPEAIKADPERFFLYMQQSLSEFNLGRDSIFNLAHHLAKSIGKNNAKVQEAIYKENNEMGRTM